MSSKRISFTTDIEQKRWLPEESQGLEDRLLGDAFQNKYDFDHPKVVLNPYQYSPLTAMVLFQTKDPACVKVTVKGDVEACDVTGRTPLATEHKVPVIGLYGGRENTVVLELLDENGKLVKQKEIRITTEEIHKKFHDIVRVERSTAKSAYGLTLVSGKNNPYPFAFDASGTIRWYLKVPTAGYGLFLLSGSRFILPEKNLFVQTEEKPHTTHMYEADYLGRIYKVFRVEKGYHHDVSEMTPGGNLLALSNTIGGQVEDSIVEIDRTTGAVVKILRLDTLFEKTFMNRPNWVHLNTISYNAKTDTALISARNLHSAVKVNWTTNEIIWILCNPLFMKKTKFRKKVLKPSGPIMWHYQQHTVYEVDADLDDDPDTLHISLFDNHWHKRRRVSFFDGNEQTSFVTLYHINEKEMTVSQGNLYEGVKSKITSNAILEYDKRRVFYMGGYLDPLIDGRKGMIYEFDYDSKEVVNQYSLKYYFYRAHELKYDLADLTTPLNVPSNFILGELRRPVKRNKLLLHYSNKIPFLFKIKEPLPEDSEIFFQARGWELHMNAQDHKVKHLFFFGKKHAYEYDLSETVQTEDIFRKLHYDTAIPLDEMECDDYRIVVHYDGSYYLCEDGFSIQA